MFAVLKARERDGRDWESHAGLLYFADLPRCCLPFLKIPQRFLQTESTAVPNLKQRVLQTHFSPVFQGGDGVGVANPREGALPLVEPLRFNTNTRQPVLPRGTCTGRLEPCPLPGAPARSPSFPSFPGRPAAPTGTQALPQLNRV